MVDTKLLNQFKSLKKFDLILWLCSVGVIAVTSVFAGDSGLFNTLTSLIGVTALIFIANGLAFGQLLVIFFALCYGIISYFFGYYGETVTYIGMSLPAAAFSFISWVRHPYKNTETVEIKRLGRFHYLLIALLSAAVTVIFYFILKALNTENLIVSTFSVATSFFASALTFLRSPYYAIAYAVNDIVLIALWGYALIGDISYLPTLACFVVFFANDLYGFISWKRMQRIQEKN